MIDWDNMPDEDIIELHKIRRDLEKTLANILMEFEQETGLELDDIGMYRENDLGDVMEYDGTIRPGNSKNISVQVRVPMRVVVQ